MFLILTVFKWSFCTVLINTLKLLKQIIFPGIQAVDGRDSTCTV